MVPDAQGQRARTARPAQAMRMPYDPARLAALLARSFVHKLTYKVDQEVLDSDSMLGHLLRHGVPEDVERD